MDSKVPGDLLASQVLGVEVGLRSRDMNKNDKKSKTILSRSLTEKGEIRIIVPSESGSSCEYKVTEKKMAQQVEHCTYTHTLSLPSPRQQKAVT